VRHLYWPKWFTWMIYKTKDISTASSALISAIFPFSLSRPPTFSFTTGNLSCMRRQLELLIFHPQMWMAAYQTNLYFLEWEESWFLFRNHKLMRNILLEGSGRKKGWRVNKKHYFDIPLVSLSILTAVAWSTPIRLWQGKKQNKKTICINYLLICLQFIP